MLKTATFTTRTAADQHRKQHGGWIFRTTTFAGQPVSDEFIWFHIGFTPSRIFTDPATAGRGGILM